MSEGCPTGCGRRVQPGQLLCRPCWHEVPKHLQRALNAAWRTWKRDFINIPAMQAYQRARDAAIASVP